MRCRPYGPQLNGSLRARIKPRERLKRKKDCRAREIISKQPHTHLLQAQQTLALLIYVRFKDVSAMKVT